MITEIEKQKKVRKKIQRRFNRLKKQGKLSASEIEIHNIIMNKHKLYLKLKEFNIKTKINIRQKVNNYNII